MEDHLPYYDWNCGRDLDIIVNKHWDLNDVKIWKNKI